MLGNTCLKVCDLLHKQLLQVDLKAGFTSEMS